MLTRWTSQERRTAAVLLIAWCGGVVSDRAGLPDRLASHAESRLHPPLPTLEQLRASAKRDTLRIRLYQASLQLRANRAYASAPPRTIDPNRANRGDWDRLPGIGPKTAAAILETRARVGRFTTTEDLLSVRGIGPRTLDRMRPYLAFEERPRRVGGSPAGGGRKPGLNDVDQAFLEGLRGIGPKLANSIVSERRRRRGFRDWSEVLEIQGIGPSKIVVLQEATRLDSSSGKTAPDPGGTP